jgi:hypothetical protein
MAHILNAAAHRQGRDSFQDELAFALSIPVVCCRDLCEC